MGSRTFSVIVPTRNRPHQLATCLDALADLESVAGGFEVIVVDDGGSTPLGSVCTAFEDRLDLHLVEQRRKGPGGARNAGAERACGRYLAFTADDCRPSRDWLVALTRHFSAHPQRLIGGSILNGLPDEYLASANHLLVEYVTLAAAPNPDRAPFFTPNNMAVPADQFRAIGGFDASIGTTGEDRELCHRWCDQGYEMAYASDASVHHYHTQTLSGFFRQHLRYGRGSLRFHRRARCRRQPPGPTAGLLPEPLAFYWRLLSFPGKHASLPRAAVLTAMLGIAQVANGCGFLIEMAKGSTAAKPNHAPLEPLHRSVSPDSSMSSQTGPDHLS